MKCVPCRTLWEQLLFLAKLHGRLWHWLPRLSKTWARLQHKMSRNCFFRKKNFFPVVEKIKMKNDNWTLNLPFCINSLPSSLSTSLWNVINPSSAYFNKSSNNPERTTRSLPPKKIRNYTMCQLSIRTKLGNCNINSSDLESFHLGKRRMRW